MNNTHANHPVPAEPGFRNAGVDELVKDVLRLGPAPTWSRELFAAVVNLAAIATALVILRPGPIVSTVLAVAAVVYFVARWAIGSRKWRAR